MNILLLNCPKKKSHTMQFNCIDHLSCENAANQFLFNLWKVISHISIKDSLSDFPKNVHNITKRHDCKNSMTIVWALIQK